MTRKFSRTSLNFVWTQDMLQNAYLEMRHTALCLRLFLHYLLEELNCFWIYWRERCFHNNTWRLMLEWNNRCKLRRSYDNSPHKMARISKQKKEMLWIVILRYYFGRYYFDIHFIKSLFKISHLGIIFVEKVAFRISDCNSANTQWQDPRKYEDSSNDLKISKY